jgi:hypothetical protein
MQELQGMLEQQETQGRHQVGWGKTLLVEQEVMLELLEMQVRLEPEVLEGLRAGLLLILIITVQPQ